METSGSFDSSHLYWAQVSVRSATIDEQANIVEGGGNGVCWQLQVTAWGSWKRANL
jgi:hypothetical protein